MSVRSEVGRLREVIVHRPGLELRRLTPANKDELLFDELLWVAKAQEEHDGLVAVLQAQGARVRRFADLLEDVLADDGLRKELVERVADVDVCGVELVDRVRSYLLDLDRAALVRHLVGGLTVREVPGAGESFVGGVLGPAAFLVQPLPNTVFTRDPSAWIGDGVVISAMSRPARKGERLLWDSVYRCHPDYTGTRVWYGDADRDDGPATIEGGDLLVLSERCVAIGLTQRTHPVAAENLAAALFHAGACEWVLAIDLPKARRTMHLDTIMTIVDVDAIVLWSPTPAIVRAYRIEPSAHDRMRVTAEPDLVRAVAAGLGVDALRVITTGEDAALADREQWDDGNNTLAVRPGVVVVYERNADTNRRLEDAGIEVHRISSYELPRGRGGPRCMSCPTARDPI